MLAELQQLADTQDAKIRQLDFKIVEIASAHETELDLQQQLRATKMQAMALDRNMRFCRFHLTRARNVQSRLERMHAFVCRSVSVIQLQLAEERKTLSHIKEVLTLSTISDYNSMCIHSHVISKCFAGFGKARDSSRRSEH